MVEFNRRQALGLGASAFIAGILSGRVAVAAADTSTLTIAFNANLPSFDGTTGPSAVNPAIQAIYRSIFDQYIAQAPDLSFQPGLLTAWGWNDDRTKVWMDVRSGVTWHDGTPLTPEDVTWSLERAADPATGNPVSNVWASIGNFTVDGQRITGDVKNFDPTIFKWMAFLTGFVLPKAYYTKVGAAGFEAKPIGTGPYMFDAYEGNSFLRLKANPNYFGGKPAFDTVVFKFVTDATSRVAEIESGSSDVTLEVPFEEYDRLREKAGLAGVSAPISDIGMLFVTNIEPMLDKNVRLAAHHAIDKAGIVKKLLRGYGVPIDTLEAPEYEAYDAEIKVGYDPKKAAELLAASGYSKDKPVKFTIQTTRGLKPKDYEMIQAIVGMWRKVGIEAEIEVYDIAKHFELRMSHKLAPTAFYNWGNAIGDPTTSTGFAMYSKSPHSAWKSDDLDAMMNPLWGEPDEAKRIAGWKAVDKYIAEQGYVIPLLQYVQPIVYKSSLKVIPNTSSALQPTLVSKV
ncbi:ABC transporter substrate-binding protein [Kaistia dalseonensis]|uniref:Peptide/nickel transport system substrate-binding protein n=1 Tax=Kaistia dalseonensis TaxID=410840 RepID=A0ABU0H7E2_9HYPH|nr:ABC transporter substrate-binding protein [Kaistia dalseonensis]MCX5495638.1 ABC transporter substrate-binding protein [Kaistia dalseonensis]MDQ0438231.1 peptide/nickel transport system substrate-binding protein [Kaistia dalseonensis]